MPPRTGLYIILGLTVLLPGGKCAKCVDEMAKADKDDANEEELVAAVKCMNEQGIEDEAVGGGYLKRAAEMGGVIGMRLYGNYLYAKNDTEFLEWWKKGIDAGDVQAETNVGIAYLHGYGTEPNLEKAYSLIKSAATKNDVTAQYNLGLLLLLGIPEIGISKDEQNAALQLTKAAHAGHLEAMMQLAILTKRNGKYNKKSLKWLQKAHVHNHPEASFTLGYMYKVGEGVEQDEEQAFEYYLKAAKKDHAAAQYEVALMYIYDTGVEGDLELGRYWMEKAAKQEHPKAMHNFASLLLKDDNPKKNLLSASQLTKQQKKDEKLALSMYAAAAAKGVPDSIYLLGYFHYKEMYGLARSNALASRYWAEASRIGHVKSQSALRKLAETDKDPNAIYHLATLNEIGVENFPKDEDLAMEMYREAAKLGQPDAIRKINGDHPPTTADEEL